MKLTDSKQAEYLDHLRQGVRRGAAAEQLGYKRHQLDGYIAENADFEARVLDAETDANEHVEEALYQAAVSGNITAAKLWLDRSDAEKRRRRGLPAAADPGDSDEPSLRELLG